MKLTEWADIAEIFGGVAIIASLIFVGLEVQENTRVTILTSDRALDQQNMAINLAVINSADFADILVRGESNRDSLSAADRARFDNYCFSRFGGRTTDQRLAFVDRREKSTPQRLFHRDILGNC